MKPAIGFMPCLHHSINIYIFHFLLFDSETGFQSRQSDDGWRIKGMRYRTMLMMAGALTGS
ncbi:MAG: hypothetical protein ACT6Q3_00285, partial [Sphingopyxis sp.]